MLKIDPKEVKTGKLHGYMLGAIAPRPIAFASTIDKDGNPNLSPYSFFNAFGSNPSTLIFSPARRVRDNTIKHTLENVREIPEVVINVVNYEMVQQTSLSSCEYAKGVNEFTKAGFTQLASETVRPFRVKESPVQFECKVREVIETGDQGGAGNLIVCEINLMHISEAVLDDEQRIDPQKIDLVGRCGQNWYVRASGNAMFQVEKPNTKLGIGIDMLPAFIRNSDILTGNDLGQLGNLEAVPDKGSILSYSNESHVSKLLDALKESDDDTAYFIAAKELIRSGRSDEAMKLLMHLDSIRN
jgi:flavin reductase (DIM6/NTAB) family NADH-FMN oxidoreductase RutF